MKRLLLLFALLGSLTLGGCAAPGANAPAGGVMISAEEGATVHVEITGDGSGSAQSTNETNQTADNRPSIDGTVTPIP